MGKRRHDTQNKVNQHADRRRTQNKRIGNSRNDFAFHSFLRLDNMSIGYTFDTKKIDWLEKTRVYVAAQNLFVITGYSGLDPEVENYRGEASDDDAGLSPGIEPRNYMPKARSFTFGVNLTF